MAKSSRWARWSSWQLRRHMTRTGSNAKRRVSMYATINLPGSSHFEYYGPASRQECNDWLKERVARLSETEQITSLLPQLVVSNREALSWKYRDGSYVIRRREYGLAMW